MEEAGAIPIKVGEADLTMDIMRTSRGSNSMAVLMDITTIIVLRMQEGSSLLRRDSIKNTLSSLISIINITASIITSKIRTILEALTQAEEEVEASKEPLPHRETEASRSNSVASRQTQAEAVVSTQTEKFQTLEEEATDLLIGLLLDTALETSELRIDSLKAEEEAASTTTSMKEDLLQELNHSTSDLMTEAKVLLEI